MAKPKRGISADKMFFDDIDDDDEDFDLDGIGDLNDMFDEDIDLDEISIDDMSDMLEGDDPLPSGGVYGVGADDEALLEADLAQAEGGRSQSRSPKQEKQGRKPQTATPDAPKRRPGDGAKQRPSDRLPSEGDRRSQPAQPSRPPRPEPARDAHGYDDEYDTGYVEDQAWGDGISEDSMENLVLPEWVVNINSKLIGNVAHAFLLEGNIRDYMVHDISIKDGIIKAFDPYLDAFDVIASYDQAHGLTFDTFTMSDEVSPEEYKGRFIELMHEAQRELDVPITDDIPRDPVEVFSIVSKIMEMPSEVIDDGEGGQFDRAKMLLFVDYPEMLVPHTTGAPRESERQLAIIINDLCRSDLADNSGCCLIMMTDDTSSVSERIRSTSSRVDRVNVPMPLLAERQDFIENVLNDDEHTLSDGRRILECEEGVSADYLAINTAGLARFQIEDIVLRAMADDTPITPELVKERKSEIITTDYNEVLEIMEPKYGFAEVGGMQQVKDFFMQEVIKPIHRGEREGVPMGVLLMGPPGTAKACYNNTIIPTPDGMRKVGDIKVGDYLFGDDGKPTQVLVVAPQGEREAYEVKTRDGRSVICSADHIWHVGRKAHGRIKWEDMTVQEMLSRGVYSPDSDGGRPNRSKFFLPVNGCCEYPERKLSLPPYVLGAFLGDGCRNAQDTLVLSGVDEELIAEVARQLGYYYLHDSSRTSTGEYGNHDWYFYHELPNDGKRGKRVHGKDLGERESILLTGTYAHDKSIPEEYKMSSREQRLELLRGLMDTDGSIRRAGGRYNVSFATCSEQLAKDVAEVVHSLGWCANIKYQARKGEPTLNKNYPDRQYFRQHDMWEVSFLMPKEERHLVFKLSRKRDIALEACDVHPAKTTRDCSRIPIASITPLHEKREMTCFYVDNESHLFLVGDYLVTHNTLLSKAVAKESNMNCVNLNLNRILSKYVGGSEHNLDRALDCAMAMEPTIIFVDEIDEALPKRNGADQTGISQRINKRLLEFLSDTTHRGQVMMLAATNYPEKIDPAFKRAGRFDNRLPMFAPGKYDRARILHISAAKANYTIKSFYTPDLLIANPFRSLRKWLEAGNTPNLENSIYDMIDFEFTMRNSLNRPVQMRSQIPKRLYRIIDKPKISLEEFYRSCDILFAGGEFPTRGGDEIGEEILTDAQYHERLIEFFGMNSAIFGDDKRVYSFCAKWILYKEMYFDQFGDLTVGKTGAELDVVINKCISLYRTFKADSPERYKKMLADGTIPDERDIPWAIVLEACTKTTAAVSGIKSMEDYALIDTSDTDYIPDEEYGRLSSNKTISYRERQEQLLTRMKLLAGDNENKAALLKS